MSYLKEKVSYLKGLAEGMAIDDSTNERKLLKAMLEVLDDIALTVDDIDEVQEELSEQLDDIDNSLADLEEAVYDGIEECIDVKCPNCGEVICLEDADVDEDDAKITCPNCNEEIEIDWDCGCADCGSKEA